MPNVKYFFLKQRHEADELKHVALHSILFLVIRIKQFRTLILGQLRLDAKSSCCMSKIIELTC